MGAAQQEPVLSGPMPLRDAPVAHKESLTVVVAVEAERVVDGERRLLGRSIQIRVGDIDSGPGQLVGLLTGSAAMRTTECMTVDEWLRSGHMHPWDEEVPSTPLQPLARALPQEGFVGH